MDAQQVDQPADAVKDPYCEPIIHSDDRDAWLAARESGIGASESSTILGLNPYESAYTLYQKRTGGIPKEEDNPLPGLARFKEWGQRLEHVVAEAFRDETGRAIARDGWMRRSLLYPWLFATPDYDESDADKGRGILECKNAGFRIAEQWEEGVPIHHQCQLQHQLVVTGKPWGSLAVLIGGNDFRWDDIAAHARFQQNLIRATQIFWKQLRGELPAPEPDAHPSTSATLMQMVADGRVVQLPDIALQWHQEQVKYAEQEREAKDRKEEYRDLLRSVLGTAAYGILPGDAGGYSFRMVERREKVIPAGQSRELRHHTKVRLDP